MTQFELTSSGARALTRAPLTRSLLMVTGCFAMGWLLAQFPWRAGFDALVRSYESHYLVMSGSGVERYVYHVAIDEETALTNYAADNPAILAVKDTPFVTLKDVHVQAESRSQVVNELRALDGISAVFTIPLICH